MGLLQEAGLERFSDTLGCKLQQSAPIFKRSVERVTHLSQHGISIRTDTIHYFRSMAEHRKSIWTKRFDELATIETELTPFLTPTSEDMKSLREDAVGQLSFQSDLLRCLNHIPFLLTAVALFKIWAVPAMAVFTPLLVWILPYILLKCLWRLPISTEQYGGILKMVWAGTGISFEPDATGRMVPKTPSMFTPRSILQTIFMGVSFLQSLIQPIQNALHLHTTDKTVLDTGRRAIRLAAIYGECMREIEGQDIRFPFSEPLQELEQLDPRRATHLLVEQPTRATLAFRTLAELELLWRLSQAPNLEFAIVAEQGAYPLFKAEAIWDCSLGEAAVPSTISFTGSSHHAALTGPNGGGKSSYLRAVLQSVLLAQAYGVAPARNLVLRRFAWISAGLRLQDRPGTLSMFETEVWFAANLLRRSSKHGPGLVLYDELFHSTNPPDGIETAKVFLQRLWTKEDVLSIVSTHVFDLVEAAPDHVQRICCAASVATDGRIQYGYAVEPGICRISSVRSIWERFGLA